jgi:hypothetical protein
VELKGQADVTNTTFFALSIEEVAKAYDSTVENETRLYRKAKYAECGQGNNTIETQYEGMPSVYTANYWLRSPGHLSTYASNIARDGHMSLHDTVTLATVGARPACYATLA